MQSSFSSSGPYGFEFEPAMQFEEENFLFEDDEEDLESELEEDEVTIYYHSKQSLFYRRVCLALRLSGLNSVLPIREHRLPSSASRECCLLAGRVAYSASQFYRLLELAIAQICGAHSARSKGVNHFRGDRGTSRRSVCRSLVPVDIAEEVLELHTVLARLEVRTPAREAARALAAAEARLLLTDQDERRWGSLTAPNGSSSSSASNYCFLFGTRPTIADVDLLTYLNSCSDWIAEAPSSVPSIKRRRQPHKQHSARLLLPSRLRRYLAENARLAPPQPSLTDWLLPDASTVVAYSSAAALGLSLVYFIIRNV